MNLPVGFCKICDDFDIDSKTLDSSKLTSQSETVACRLLSKNNLMFAIDFFEQLDKFILNQSVSKVLTPILSTISSFYSTMRKIYFEYFFEQYENDINNENFAAIMQKYTKIFEPLIKNCKHQRIVNSNVAKLYRARAGYISETGTIDDMAIDFKYPHYGSALMNPPSSLANEGRFNRDGFSYYYLSSTLDGAIAEVRPEVGSFCSVAEFYANTELYLFYPNTIDELNTYLLKPVYDSKQHYRYTQFFSDIVFNCGLDGIQYNGVQTDIYCIVCFYPSKINYVDYSEDLFQIKHAFYEKVLCKPKFTNYKDWEHLDSSNEKKDEKREEQIEHMIDREKHRK